jgi:hypothetical protein
LETLLKIFSGNNHPASYPMGTWALSLGVKRPGREADHSPPSSAEVKNAWSYTSIPQYVFMAWCLVKHRDVFTFTFTFTYTFTVWFLVKEMDARPGSKNLFLGLYVCVVLPLREPARQKQ